MPTVDVIPVTLSNACTGAKSLVELYVGYPADWKNRFLNPAVAYVSSGDVVYSAGITTSFANIDTWTDTWRDIKDSGLTDPVTNTDFNFSRVNSLQLSSGPFGSDDTRPGYSTGFRRFGFLQSRRVFRYQPGRISGFTFGLRSSTELTYATAGFKNLSFQSAGYPCPAPLPVS